MEDLKTPSLSLSYLRANSKQICPECGSQMTQVDRIRENGVTFIWYKCTQESCSGQWLQKLQQTSFTLSTVRQVVGAI